MAQSRRKKISIFLIILLSVFPLLTALFIFASRMVSSVSLPQELASPPAQVNSYFVNPEPAGASAPHSTNGPISSTQSVVVNAAPSSTPTLQPPPGSKPTPGGRIWLEMIRENSALFAAGVENFNRDFGAAFLPDLPTTATITSEQIRWLKGKAPLISQLLRLGEAGDIDFYNDPRLLRLREPELSLCAGARRFSEAFLQLLGRHALWRRQEKDYAGAGRSLLAALRLSAMLELNSATNTDYPYFPAVERYLHEAVRDPRWPVDQFQPLLNELTRIESQRFPRQGITRYFVKLYLNERGLIVKEMNRTTWKSPIFGYDLNTNMPRYWGPLRIGKNEFGIEMPRPGLMLATSLAAMRNKTRAAESLRQYDEAWRQLLEASRKPYPEWRTERKRLFSPEKMHGNSLLVNSNGLGGAMMSMIVPYYDFTMVIRVHQAAVHLCRLGLMWRLDPKGTLAARKDGDLSGNPHDPWRDPFTEKPLLLDNPTSPTLIYSLGPDLKDQHGAEALDTNNPYQTKGDIVIRLPGLP